MRKTEMDVWKLPAMMSLPLGWAQVVDYVPVGTLEMDETVQVSLFLDPMCEDELCGMHVPDTVIVFF